jgi:hypothetical protein
VYAKRRQEFITRFASGSEPVVFHTRPARLQRLFNRHALVESDVRVRYERIPMAERWGHAERPSNGSISAWVVSAIDEQRRLKKVGGKGREADMYAGTFATIEVPRDHPWAPVVWGPQADLRKGSAADKQKKKAASKKKKEKQDADWRSEIFVEPIAVNLTKEAADEAEDGMPQKDAKPGLTLSYLQPLDNVMVQFARIGAASNLVVSPIPAVHLVVHGTQDVLLVPPRLASSTRDAVEPQSTAAFGAYPEKDGALRCSLRPGDLLFIPQLWGMSYASSQGESVSVGGKLAWR